MTNILDYTLKSIAIIDTIVDRSSDFFLNSRRRKWENIKNIVQISSNVVTTISDVLATHSHKNLLAPPKLYEDIINEKLEQYEEDNTIKSVLMEILDEYEDRAKRYFN